jgi:hypothetical protein
MAVEVNIPASGALGAPPAHAPIESSQPVQADAGSIVVFDRATGQPTGEVVRPEDRARANERELLPLTYGKTADGAAPQSNVPGKEIGKVDPFYEAVAKRNAERAKDTMPAASDSDSPSRGLPGTAPIPAARKRPPLATEGGFGMGGDVAYFPMDGNEVRELVNGLMDQLHERMKNDLRFSLAICYPRIAVKLQLIVEAEAEVGGTGFNVEYVAAHDKTPLEVAKECCDSVVFVLKEQRREFDEAGNVETPPDAIRIELGLDVPRKQMVQTGAGKMMSDRPLGW